MKLRSVNLFLARSNLANWLPTPACPIGPTGPPPPGLDVPPRDRLSPLDHNIRGESPCQIIGYPYRTYVSRRLAAKWPELGAWKVV